MNSNREKQLQDELTDALQDELADALSRFCKTEYYRKFSADQNSNHHLAQMLRKIADELDIQGIIE